MQKEINFSGLYSSIHSFISDNNLEEKADKLFGKNWEADDDINQVRELLNSINNKYDVKHIEENTKRDVRSDDYIKVFKKLEYFKFDRQTGACSRIGLLTENEAELQDDCEHTTIQGYEPLTKTEECKMMIIENYIDWYCHDEDEREVMKLNARVYAHEDHVDEIGSMFPQVDGKNENNC